MFDIENIKISLEKSLNNANSLEEISKLKIHYLGKKGELTIVLKSLSSLEDEERKTQGAKINLLKKHIIESIDAKYNKIKKEILNKKLESESIDITLPSHHHKKGSIHPISQCLEELTCILSNLGFEMKEGPSITNEWNNFTSLNMDENHPARQMHDTFYLNSENNDEQKLLRTHTSAEQVKILKNSELPTRFFVPGRTYRSDNDSTHSPMFHQIEGVVVEKNIGMGHLKFIINHIIKSFFEGQKLETRFRPSFFPFTEPSIEVDIKIQDGKWMEVMGCGIIHPNILKYSNIDPSSYRGLAFGLGIDRFAMLKYGIKDLRQMFEGDLRWSRHYGFSSFDIPSLVRGLTK